MTRLSENRTRKTSSLRRRHAGVGPPANGPSSGKRAAGAVAKPVEDGIADNWENEGGPLRAKSGIAIMPDIVVGPVPRPVNAPMSDPLLAMRAKFLSDFADWLIGRHPDTYRPRARIMRQWTEASRLHGSPAQHR
jgi:hypothetical protein